MNTKSVIGMVIILGFMTLGLYTFMSNQVQSVTIANARVAKQTVQAIGVVDFESVEYDIEKKRMTFYLMDVDPKKFDANGEPDKLKVVYEGEIPGNFEQAISVTVVGKAGEDGFHAERMLVKCPSKYQGEDGKIYEEEEEREYTSSGA
ncbi:MAG: cytochrome c maturation protein CcmE [candidate division Zixibacteria bacterium]|nr:cytochrome c maturation protein CcmE [candidate division Zixibacteria bacterium]